jgi:hypothetical protein
MRVLAFFAASPQADVIRSNPQHKQSDSTVLTPEHGVDNQDWVFQKEAQSLMRWGFALIAYSRRISTPCSGVRTVETIEIVIHRRIEAPLPFPGRSRLNRADRHSRAKPRWSALYRRQVEMSPYPPS